MDCQTNHKRFLPNSKECFVCGEDNPAGLRIRMYVENDVVKTHWRPITHHCGYKNVVHGGVIAALLDECMAWAATRCTGRTCVTGDISIRYAKRVPGDHELTVYAEVVKPGKRLVHVQARIVDDTGEEYAHAKGRFVAMTAEETLEVDDYLLYRGGEERVFDPLRAQAAQGECV